MNEPGWLVRKDVVAVLGARPKTLCEVVCRCNNGEQKFDIALREFLDSFYADPRLRATAIKDRPGRVDALHDAYISAVAEHLARTYGLPVPEWTEEQGHDLHEPFFAGGLESLKGILVAESPTAFRRRLLFVSRNALSRPRLAEAKGETESAQAPNPEDLSPHSASPLSGE